MTALAARSVLTSPRTSSLASSLSHELWALIEAAYASDGAEMLQSSIALDTLLRDVDRLALRGDETDDLIVVLHADLADTRDEVREWRDSAKAIAASLDAEDVDPDTEAAEVWAENVLDAIQTLRGGSLRGRPGWGIVSLPMGSERGKVLGEIALCEDASLLLDAQQVEEATQNRSEIVEAIASRLEEL